MTARQDFGSPDAADILLAIAHEYLRRQSMPELLRLILSATTRQQAIGFLQAAVIEQKAYPD